MEYAECMVEDAVTISRSTTDVAAMSCKRGSTDGTSSPNPIRVNVVRISLINASHVVCMSAHIPSVRDEGHEDTDAGGNLYINWVWRKARATLVTAVIHDAQLSGGGVTPNDVQASRSHCLYADAATSQLEPAPGAYATCVYCVVARSNTGGGVPLTLFDMSSTSINGSEGISAIGS